MPPAVAQHHPHPRVIDDLEPRPPAPAQLRERYADWLTVAVTQPLTDADIESLAAALDRGES